MSLIFHSGQIGMYLLMCGFKSGLIGIDLFYFIFKSGLICLC